MHRNSKNVEIPRNNTEKQNTKIIYSTFSYLERNSEIYYSLVPFRKPLEDLSKTALVISLKHEVKAPDAAKPAKKDCKNRTRVKTCSQNWHFSGILK